MLEKIRRGVLSAALGVTCIAAACAMIIVPSATVRGEKKCNYDQQTLIMQDREFSRKFKESTYHADRRVHRIERGEATIEFSRGGCEILHISIDYSVPANGPAFSIEEVSQRVVSLVREFGGGELATADEFAAAFRNKKFLRHRGRGIFDGFASGKAGVMFGFGYTVRDGRHEIGAFLLHLP